MKRLSIILILLAMVSIANADLVLTVNGLDTSMPIEVESKDDIIIVVTGQTDEQKESYSVTCEMGGKLKPFTELNTLAEKPKEGDYLFTFEDEELGLAIVNLTVGDVLDYQLILFKVPDANTVIFGIDSDAIEIPEPQPEHEPNQPSTSPYPNLKFKPRQEKGKILITCPPVVKSSEFTIKDTIGKGRAFTTHNGSVALLDGNVVEVTSDITTNTLWTADNIYHVLNPIDVNNALLVIEPGTIVAFAAGTNAGISIINGGALTSCGTPGNEIVYTSDATYPDYEDYYCPIYITETASLATQVKYSIIEWTYAGVVVLDRKLKTNIENNYFVNCVFGVVEYGLDHTHITNNLFYGSGYGAIEIYMESLGGEASSDSQIYIQNNTCDYSPQWDGITIYGSLDPNDAGFLFLANNLLTYNGRYGICLTSADPEKDAYIYGPIANNGYYNNYYNTNADFNEVGPVYLATDPYVEGSTGYAPICYIDQQCPLVDGGFNFIQQTPMIGETTATTGIPDSNTTDIGFHYCHWDYNNVGEGDYYPVDLDENLKVDFKDFAILANGWQTTYDINELADLCHNWLLQGGPAQNIVPSFDQDPNNLTGDVTVTVNVSDNEITRVYMFVDGEKYLQFGDIQENPTTYLETQYFHNGPHTVKIISQDANNMVYCSEAVDVNFNNSVSSLIMDESFTPGEDFHIMALGNGNYDISVYDIVNETTTYSGTSTGQINITIPAASFTEEYGAYDFKITPQGDPGNPLFNFLIRRKFNYAELYGAGAGARADGNWVMKMVVSIGDKKLEKAKEECWRAALRAGVKKGFAPGIIVPAFGDEWFESLCLALTFPHCKIWYHVGHGNYKTIWPWNPERTFISSPSGKIFSYLKKDLDPVPPDYERVWGYEGCHSIAELGFAGTDELIWVQVNACYSCRNLDFAIACGSDNDDPYYDPIGDQVYIGWKNSALVYDILGKYNEFEYDFWKDLQSGANLQSAVMDNLPPAGGTRILENFRYFGVIDWQYASFDHPSIN